MAPNSGWFEQAKVADAEKARLEAEDCGRLIEITRLEMGWTQARLAEAAGVTETDVTQFEAGQVYPIEPAFSQYLRALGRMS